MKNIRRIFMTMEAASYSVEVSSKSLKVVNVDSLSDIPVLNGAVTVDLDGVLCLGGRGNNLFSNTSRLLELKRIVGESERLLISTGRFNLEDGIVSDIFEKRRKLDHLAVSYCPVLTRESRINLESFFNRVTPGCTVDFDVGPKKYLACNRKTLDFGKNSLDNNLNLTILGSGFFDKRVAKKIGEIRGSFDGLTFYSLGRGLL